MANRTVVSSSRAPRAIGPYSQGIRADKLLFLSGQIPIDPASGELVGGDIEAQTRQVLNNMSAVLEAAGASLSDVVKTTVFLVDLADFPAFNATYASFFTTDPPARSTVQVAALPKGARVEVEAIALLE
ncbi:MAG TPA: RidA family protein [Polyangiaceae bacterium]|nr:RidA family protein [Polyangiaceae bacterium]